MRFDPRRYPGTPPQGPTLVLEGSCHAVHATGSVERPVEPVGDAPRAPVLDPGRIRWSLAYGSNAAPDRLVDKGLDRLGAVLLPASVLGWRRVWEARRSSTTAVPLTLAPAPGERLDAWVVGLDADDTDRLDTSEGRGTRYGLGRLGPAAVAGRFLLDDVLAYVATSATSLITVGGVALGYPDHDQASALRHLGLPGRTTLAARATGEEIVGPWPGTPLVDLPLFAYGTLQPDGRHHGRVAQLTDVVGTAEAVGEVIDTVHGWPAARFDRPGSVAGTLLAPRTSADAVRLYDTTDRLEGVPHLFRRVAVRVNCGGDERWAAGYEWAEERLPERGGA